MRIAVIAGLLLAIQACKGGCRNTTHSEKPWPSEIGAATKRVAEACGHPAKRLDGTNDQGEPVATGGFAIDCESAAATSLLAEAHRTLRLQGLYLFLSEQRFGIAGHPDTLGVLATRDPYEVMTTMGTNAANYDKGTADIIAWLRALEVEQPFELTGIGFDFLSGRFTTPVKDPAGLANRMYEFCPDIVDQGVGDVGALAEELRTKQTLYFWWD